MPIIRQTDFSDLITVDHRDGFPRREVAEKLGTYGIVVLRGFVAGDELAALREEATDMAARPHHHRHVKDGAVVATYGWEHLTPQACPRSREFVRRPFVRQAAEDFFDPYDTKCECVRSLHYQGVGIGNEHWHIDPATCLKFFVYLTDTTQANGAFEYCVGSHKDGFLRRLHHHMAHNVANAPDRLALRVDDADIVASLPIEAEAGSMIIFNPNGYHRAGLVELGLERLVLAIYYISTGTMRLPDAETPDVLAGGFTPPQHDALMTFAPNLRDAMTHPRNLPRTYYYRQK